MLTKKEIELLEYMDYQVLNNGIAGWLGNRAYEKMFEFLEILHKRNSELDQKVAAIFFQSYGIRLRVLPTSKFYIYSRNKRII